MQRPSANLANWLWRQGSGDTQGMTPIPTSWWINYGTYVPAKGSVNAINPESESIGKMPVLMGFTGIGTLGAAT